MLAPCAQEGRAELVGAPLPAPPSSPRAPRECPTDNGAPSLLFLCALLSEVLIKVLCTAWRLVRKRLSFVFCREAVSSGRAASAEHRLLGGDQQDGHGALWAKQPSHGAWPCAPAPGGNHPGQKETGPGVRS